MTKTFALCIIILFSFAACGPKVQLQTDAEINQAEKNGTLIDLYTTLSDKLAANKHAAPEEKAQLAKIKQRIAQQQTNIIQQQMTTDNLPMRLITKLKQQSTKMKFFLGQLFQPLWLAISQREQTTTQKIAAQEEALFHMIGQPVDQQQTAMTKLLHLWSSDDDSDLFQQKRSELLTKYHTMGTKAEANKAWKRAEDIYAFLMSVESNKDNKLALLRVAKNKLIDQLKEEEFDQAFDSLQTLAAVDGAAPYIAESSESLSVLINYYVEQGDSFFNESQLKKALDSFLKAKTSRRIILGADASISQEEITFIDHMITSSEEAKEEDALGQALTYLLYVQEIAPAYPNLKTNMNSLQQQIRASAIKRIAILDFDSAKKGIGAAISSKVSGYLFNNASNAFRIVERSALKQMIQEQEIRAFKTDHDVGLDAANYMLQGRILEANIDTVQNDGSKTERVVIEHHKVNNPDYAAWVKLSESKRELTAEPPKTIIKKELENISYKVRMIRKVGILSAAFSLIDTTNGNVLYSDSSKTQKVYSDVSSDGVSIGEFHQEMKMADLPSDVEIFDTLYSELAKDIGVKMLALLGSPEKTYYKNALAFAKLKKFNVAIENMADAFVLNQSKKLDTQDSMNKMLQYIAYINLQD